MDIKGLSSLEVETRIKENKTNKAKKFKSKSHLQIIFESFFNFFNIILFGVAITFLIVQLVVPDGIKYIPITKYGFLFVILLNALTSIISQEISKKTVEKMKIISSNKVVVIRDNKEIEINPQDIVIDDVIKLTSGNYIPCDLTLLEGTLLVNESNLTGESNGVKKLVGDEVLSGSFVISGVAYLKAIKVGNDTYVSEIEKRVKSIKKKKSQLMQDIYKIIRILLFLIIPSVIVTFIKTYSIGDNGVPWTFSIDVITKSATVLVGMIPIGMILLTSITLSKSIISLFKKHNTMIQELYAIENLSRVDMICLDKTGTLTTQNFIYEKEIILNSKINLKELMPNFIGAFLDKNRTLLALEKHFGSNTNKDIKEVIPFSSNTKSSEVIFNDGEHIVLGAPEYIFKDEKILKEVEEYSKDGYRVLALKVNDTPGALFLLKDEQRKGIKDTLSYFYSLGIDIKIISGDNPLTVSNVARDCGVKESEKYIFMENVPLSEIKNICDKYVIFGRTSPEQKQEIIKCLQLKNRKVGYCGDGVNDTESLRQATCSIALNSGADSAKAVSDVILLDDDFSHLPTVIREGRKVVSNIERSILLFLSKSFYIGLFSLFSVFLPKGLPIEIEAIYIYQFVEIALCGLLLSLQNNKPGPQRPHFIKEVLFKSSSFGLFLTISSFIPIIFATFLDMPNSVYLIPLFVSISGIIILLFTIKPLEKYTFIILLIAIALSTLLLFALPDIFLNPNYLKGADGIKGQINLLISDLFNLNIYYGFKKPEIILTFLFLLISGPLYYAIDLAFKLIKKLYLNRK